MVEEGTGRESKGMGEREGRMGGGEKGEGEEKGNGG